MRKLLSAILVMVIIVCVMPVTVFGEEPEYVTIGGHEIPKDITEICIGADNTRMGELGFKRGDFYFISEINISELYKKLPQLESITIAKSRIKNEYRFSKFKDLKTLELYECKGISDLSFAPNCKNLTEFAFTQDGLKDISYIGKMTRLKKLTIADATTYGYILSEYIELKKKVQSGGHLWDLSPLENLKDLTDLTVEGAAIEDISFLENMQKLTSFTLANAVKTDLSPLGELENLKSFTLKNSGARFIKQSAWYYHIDLPVMKRLNYLSLNSCEINEDALSKLPELKTLKLIGSNIVGKNEEKDSGSQNLPKIEALILDDVRIAVDVLSGFTSLKSLEIYDSSFYDADDPDADYYYSLDFLKNMHSLKRLTVCECFINDISGIKNLSELEYIDLSNNRLRKLPSLKKLTNLKHLDLSYAFFGDSSERYYDDGVLSPIGDLKKLEYLDISWIYDLPDDYSLWKPGVKDSIFDVLASLPELKTLKISAIYKYGNLMEDKEKERSKDFEEKMPYCEVSIEYADIIFD